MRVAMSLPLLLVLGVVGCASTSMSSLVNSNISPREYQRVMVAFPLADLELRQVAEDEFVRRAAVPDRFVPSYKLFFPGQQYGDEEFVAVLRENNVDAVLMISLSDAGTSSVYVPQGSSTTTCTTWTSSQGCVQASTSTSGGYSLNKPWASFTAALVDLEQSAVVWYATARTGGNAFADSEDLLRSMARKTMETLNGDGVVR